MLQFTRLGKHLMHQTKCIVIPIIIVAHIIVSTKINVKINKNGI